MKNNLALGLLSFGVCALSCTEKPKTQTDASSVPQHIQVVTSPLTCSDSSLQSFLRSSVGVCDQDLKIKAYEEDYLKRDQSDKFSCDSVLTEETDSSWIQTRRAVLLNKADTTEASALMWYEEHTLKRDQSKWINMGYVLFYDNNTEQTMHIQEKRNQQNVPIFKLACYLDKRQPVKD